MRGRIFSVASLWIGRPLSSISIVTTAASVPSLRSISCDLADVDAGDAHRRVRRGSSWPTRTRALSAEAVRERDVLGEAEVARRSRRRAATIAPTVIGFAPVRSLRSWFVGERPSAARPCSLVVVSVPWLPGTLPIDRSGRRRTVSLPASHSLGWPGARRVRVRVDVQVVVAASGPLAGAERRAALVVRALRRGDDDEALPGAVARRPR